MNGNFVPLPSTGITKTLVDKDFYLDYVIYSISGDHKHWVTIIVKKWFCKKVIKDAEV